LLQDIFIATQHLLLARLHCVYIPNVIEIKESFCGRTGGHLKPTLLGPD